MKKNQRDETPANRSIKASNVRVIDQDGEMLGVMSLDDGVARAEAVGLDLIQVAGNGDVPVCKILDLGKFKYEAQKKKAAARKKQKVIHVKEVKFRPNIDENDFQIKLKKARQFIEAGDKVKISLRFRGREMAHNEIGQRVLKRLEESIQDIAKVDQRPRMEGVQLIMLLSPR